MAQTVDQTIADAIEIIKDKLYMTFHPEESSARSSPNYVLFTNDKSLVFTSFFADFGPLDLGHTYKFCTQLQDTLAKAHASGKPVVYSCSNHPHARSNGAVMMCAYMIFVHNCTAERAYGPFMGINPPFITFRDAGFCINTFPITVLDCARAMRRAVTLGHFNYQTFNLNGFQALSKLQNGDFSWIVPGKFLAFSGPLTKRRQLSPGVFSLTPEGYVPVMKKLDVSCIVRFNSKCYDRNVFLMNGIRHVDLYYEDGGNPSEEILQAFLQLCETERAAIAVHCKAGLGRTGTNIAAYMMKHYGYTARECMAWCRLCRPGSIVGPQQQYLASIEARMFREGAEYRLRHRLPNPAGSDEKSVASNSGSVDGVLSTYTGGSQGAQTVASMHSLSNSNGTNSDLVARVMTPPLVSGQRCKPAATESLFRNVVSGNKRDDGHGSSHNTPRGGAHGGQAVITGGAQSQKGPYSLPHAGNDAEARRPSTSGGLTHKGNNASSPLRGSVDAHAASFSSYGQGQQQGQSAQAQHGLQNQNYNTSNAHPHGHSHGQGSPVKGYATHHTSHSDEHQGGPGHSGSIPDGRYGSPARTEQHHHSDFRSAAPHSPPVAVTQSASYAASPSGRRSASSMRGYQQSPSASYSLASPGYPSSNGASGSKVEYFDAGKSPVQGDGTRLRFASMPQDTTQRPGTSGGIRNPSPLSSTNNAALAAAYQVKQQSGAVGGQRLQDFSSFDASGGSGGYGLSGTAVAVARPRTSGGFLPSTSSGQGRSASNGRGSSMKKRF